MSTIFVFDVRPEHMGKTCNLAFYMPPAFPFPDLSPVKIRSPGGIAVLSVNANGAVGSKLIGQVPSIEPANQYKIASMPCAAGQTVMYKIESTSGLDMEFFQMTSPPLGPFMSIS